MSDPTTYPTLDEVALVIFEANGHEDPMREPKAWRRSSALAAQIMALYENGETT